MAYFVELTKLYGENANLEDSLADWMLFLKCLEDETKKAIEITKKLLDLGSDISIS